MRGSHCDSCQINQHAIPGQFHAWRKRRIGRRIAEFMRHVDEDRPLRPKLLSQRNGLLQAEVSDVWLVAQGIEDEDVQIFQPDQRRFRDLTGVGTVSYVAEAKA